jgi:hypothetical protein
LLDKHCVPSLVDKVRHIGQRLPIASPDLEAPTIRRADTLKYGF